MKILIPIILSVTLYAFSIKDDLNVPENQLILQPDTKLEVVSQLDFYSDTPFVDQINKQVSQLLTTNNDQNLEQQIKIDENNGEVIHSLQYWLEYLDDDYQEDTIYNTQNISIQQNDIVNNDSNENQKALEQFSVIQINNSETQKQNSKNQQNQISKQEEQIENNIDNQIEHSRLLKYIQFKEVEQQEKQQQNSQNIIQKIEEKNPLKLLLLYSDTNKQQNLIKNEQKIETNEQILEQINKEKKDRINKMQSLIIEELKDKKPEPQKEENFLEKDYIEWEMKTLITNNNNLRMR